jgi:putative ABC transport system permease protein
VTRFYRALLRLYPAGFRSEYGDELATAFAQVEREHTGPLAPVILMAKAVADVGPNALAVHLDILRQDLRYTVRSLRRAPGFALTAILVVALGVGANTAAFSLADFVLLRPLPYPEPDRLVKLWQSTPGYGTMELSPANFRDWETMATSSFSGMGAYWEGAVNLVGDGEPRRLASARVTPELLPLVGVGAFMGRIIVPADSMGEPTVVISHELWRTQFGGNAGVLGRTVRLDGTPHTIVGVMPPDFHFPSRSVDLWTPLILMGEDFEDRNDNYLDGVARLRPGVTLEAAQAELDRVAKQLELQYPKELERSGAFVLRAQDEISQRSRMLVIALCGAALCILLLACANLASLLLARGLNRARELAVRTALGAGRERLMRQLITESIGLAVLGGLVGVGLAAAGVPLLAQLVPESLPIADHPSVDLRVLAFAAALIAITGLIFGIAPALRAGQGALAALRDGTRTGGGRRQRIRSALVVLEVVGSIVLLVSSGLLMRTIWKIQAIEPGFRTEDVTVLRTALPLPKYGKVATRERFYDRVLDDVRALPGVTNAAYITGLPMDMRGGIWPVQLNGTEVLRDAETSASLRYVTPGFFATLGIPLRLGRDVEDGDTQDRPYVAVVSESFVQRHWPGQDPIGKRFGLAMNERTIVGVVGDTKVRGLDRTSEPQVYLPSAQVADNSIIGYLPKELVIRSTLPAEQWMPAVRRIVAAVDPEQPISHIRPLAEVVAGDTAARRVQLRLLAILSAIALVIAGVGVHGLLSFAVSQRTQELGIRRALGAQAGSIVVMVLREGLVLAVIGTVIGIGIALAVARGMGALLYGVPAGDPVTIAAAAGLCLLVAVVGCARPAVRAARVDPMTALREG